MDADDVILTPAPSRSARARGSLAWNSGGGGSTSGNGLGGVSIQPSLRVPYQPDETLDFDQPDFESLPAAEAAPGGKRRRYARKRAPSRKKRRGGVATGRVGKPRTKKRRRKGTRRRRTKRYTVRKGKIRVYSPAAGVQRSFSASKILSQISPGTIEAAASRLSRGRRGGRRKKR